MVSGSVYDVGDGVEITIDEAVTNKAIWLSIYPGVTYNNLTFYPMLIKGTQNKPYEPYGASPSPDYPSEVETVGNNVQLLDESKASVKTVNGMTLSYSKEQGLILNGTTTAQTNFWLLNLGEELEAGNYTLSSNVNLENKGAYALKASNSNLVQSNLK